MVANVPPAPTVGGAELVVGPGATGAGPVVPRSPLQALATQQSRKTDVFTCTDYLSVDVTAYLAPALYRCNSLTPWCLPLTLESPTRFFRHTCTRQAPDPCSPPWCRQASIGKRPGTRPGGVGGER